MKGMPIRVQRKRTKGYRMPPNTVSVTRPGKWGNPFKIGEGWLIPNKGEFDFITPTSTDQCVELFRTYAESCMSNPDSWMVKDIHELRGKNLACFCKIGEACHADVLLELSNK